MSDFHPNNLQRAMLHYSVVDPNCGTIGVQAGTGSGKSFGSGLVTKLLGELQPPEAPEPPTLLWLTDTMSRAESVVLPVCQTLLADQWKWSPTPTRWYWEHRRTGARIWIRYFHRRQRDDQASNIEGIPHACGVICEESQTLPPAVAPIAAKRLRQKGYRPRRLFIGLPRADAWWMQEVERVRAARGHDAAVGLRATSLVNIKNLGAHYIDDLKATMSPRQFRAEVLNEPSAPDGAVYPDWEPTVGASLLDWTPPAGTEVVLGIDYGDVWPHVLVMVDDGATLTIVDELAPDNILPQSLAERVVSHCERRGWNIWRAAGDPGARTRSRHGGASQRRAIEQVLPRGIAYPSDSRRDILLGIERVSRLILDGTGRRRLLCTEECWAAGMKTQGRSFAKSIMGYRWPEGGGDRPWKDDRHDHAMDALRYYVACFHWNDAQVVTGPSVRAQQRVRAGRVR